MEKLKLNFKKKKKEQEAEAELENTPSEGKDAADNIDEPPVAPTEADVAEAAVKKGNKLAKFDYFWTILSTLYAIVSTCIFVAKDWMGETVSYVVIGLLCVYIIAFIVILVITLRRPGKKRSKPLKYYRSLLKIFRGISNIAFLVLSAVTMAGVVSGGLDLGKWSAFCATFFVAIVKLALSISKFILKIYRKRIGKKYSVKVMRYVNGKLQKKNISHKYLENSYKNDD